jgi:hypothetical protein
MRPGTRTKLEQLEVDAVQAQADDLRGEIVAYLGQASSGYRKVEICEALRHKSLSTGIDTWATITAMNPVTINEVPGPPTLQSRLLVAGDTHGNGWWLRTLAELAVKLGCCSASFLETAIEGLASDIQAPDGAFVLLELATLHVS